MRTVNPLVYASRHYLHDLAVFCETVNTPPESGPFYMLCGYTMENLFNNYDRFADPVGFMCTQYALNLIDQGIYTYFPQFTQKWLCQSLPFLNVRACHAHHGGFGSSPDTIVWFVRHHWKRSDATSINWNQSFALYTRFFIDQYVPTTLPELDVAQLLQALFVDPDCYDLREMMGWERVWANDVSSALK